MIPTGYFTSRQEILQWLHHLTALPIHKIEQLGSANIYCHILDAAYPNKVPLARVKWNAYLEVDFIHNFKILQTSFQRLGINKIIDIEKLAKAKYQDNLEFIQWMKWFMAEKIAQNGSYNAASRRTNAEVYLLFTERKPIDTKNTIIQKHQKTHQEIKMPHTKENKKQTDKKNPGSQTLRCQKQSQTLRSQKQLQPVCLMSKLDSSQLKKECNKQNDGEGGKGVEGKVRKGKIQVVTKSSQFGLRQQKMNQSKEQQQCF